jgi:hypothetical protein
MSKRYILAGVYAAMFVFFSGCTQKLEKQIEGLNAEKSNLQKRLSMSESKVLELSGNLKNCEIKSSEMGSNIFTLNQEAKGLNAKLLYVTESKSNEVKNFTTQVVNLSGQLAETEKKLQSVQLELASATGELKATAREKENAKKEADSKATLKVQVGLTMGSGETKPVSNNKLYITKESFCRIVGCKHTYSNNRAADEAVDWWFGKKFPISAASSSRIEESIAQVAISIGTTDFSGQVVYENLAPGSYYVMGATLAGGGATLMKAVTLKAGQNQLSLGNEDMLSNAK